MTPKTKVQYADEVKPLTFMQQGFVSLFTGNVKETAELAKISFDYAKQLYAKPHIKHAIASRHKQEYNPLIATRQDRQAFWTAIMLDKLKNEDNARVAQSMPDRLKASELLGRSEADFTDILRMNSKEEDFALDTVEKKEAQAIATIRLAEIIIHKGADVPQLAADATDVFHDEVIVADSTPDSKSI